MLSNRHPIARFLVLAIVLAFPSWSAAQQQPPNNGNGNQGGILIDADGVLRNARIAPRKRPIPAARKSKGEADVRAISLRRLEDELRAAEAQFDSMPGELKTLGGLTAIDEIVLVAEDRDILLIGPGEDPVDEEGMLYVGSRTGSPLIRTEDWIVVLRSAQRGQSQIRCSIDPDPERLRQYDARIRESVGQVTLASAPQWYNQLAQILGRQPVTIGGVPADSRVSVLLAAADYSMKTIALGTEPSGVKAIKSQLALAGGDKGASMQRWWFAPLYDPVEVDATRSAFRLSGPRVQLCAQQELITPSGQRTSAAHTRLSTQKFAQNFTEHYGELATVRPVFAELRQLFDVAVAATIIVRERFPERAKWAMDGYLDEKSLPTPTYSVPRFVDSASTTRRVNSTTVVGLVGGVSLNPIDVLENEIEQKTPRALTPRPAADIRGKKFVWAVER